MLVLLLAFCIAVSPADASYAQAYAASGVWVPGPGLLLVRDAGLGLELPVFRLGLGDTVVHHTLGAVSFHFRSIYGPLISPRYQNRY